MTLRDVRGVARSSASPRKRGTAAVSALLIALSLAACDDGQGAAEGERVRTGLFPIMEGGRWGLMDRQGKIVVQPTFESRADLGKTVLHLTRGRTWNGRSSHTDGTAPATVPAQFNAYQGRLTEGMALISRDQRYGFLSERGDIMIALQFDDAHPFSEGRAAIRVGQKWGYVDVTGRLVINPQFGGGGGVGPFSDGVAAVSSGLKWGYVDHDGDIVVNPQFEAADSFQDGRAFVRAGGKVGLIDKAGTYVVNPNFDEFHPFGDGLAAVRRDDKWGFIDRDGQVVIPFQFALVPWGGYKPTLWSNRPWLPPAWDEDIRGGRAGFRDGLAVVVVGQVRDSVDQASGQSFKVGGKYGVIDTEGRYVVTPQFDAMEPFEDGRALVKADGKYGYVEQDGGITINLDFDEAASFAGGLARVRIGDKWGFIGRNGRLVVNPQFDAADDFFDGLAEVVADGQLGYIDVTGAYVRQLTPMYARAPQSAETALDARYPGWRYASINASDLPTMSRSSAIQAYVVGGDFDGNGERDYAVRIVTGEYTGASRDAPTVTVIALVANGPSFTPHDLGWGDYLVVKNRGAKIRTGTTEWITLERDTPVSGSYSSDLDMLHIWRQGRFDGGWGDVGRAIWEEPLS